MRSTLYVDLVSSNLTELTYLLLGELRVRVASSGFPVIMSPTHRDNFISSLPICRSFKSLSFLIAVARPQIAV